MSGLRLGWRLGRGFKSRLNACRLKQSPALFHSCSRSAKGAATAPARTQPSSIIYGPSIRYTEAPARHKRAPPGPKISQEDLLRARNEAIDPNDLSATLEAHRDANLRNKIRAVAPKGQDGDIMRPSFLKDAPLPPHVPTLPSGDAQSHVASQSMELDGAPQEQVEQLLSSFQDKPKSDPSQPLPNDVFFSMIERARRDFLRDVEKPLQPFVDPSAPLACLDSIHRVRLLTQGTTARGRSYYQKATQMIHAQHMQDYLGKAVKLDPAFARGSLFFEPWRLQPTREPISRMKRFDQEVRLFTEWMELSTAEEAAREAIYQSVLDIVHTASPGVQVEKFGSSSTGLAMPTSDIDVRIFQSDEMKGKSAHVDADKARKEFNKHIKAVQAAFENHADFSSVVRYGGRFPLVGAVHTATGLSVQVVAAPSTIAARERVAAYLAELPTLKPLYMIVKTMLDMRALTKVWNGGLSSYTIFMMVVASLKLNEKPTKDIGQQLIDFFYFYGGLNTYTWGIAIEPKAHLFKKKPSPSVAERLAAKTDEFAAGKLRMCPPALQQKYLLCLQDPANPYNDAARKSFAIKHVCTTFRDHQSMLKARLDPRHTTDHPSREPLLRHIVGRCDLVYDVQRARVELFGESLMGDKAGPVARARETETSAATAAAALAAVQPPRWIGQQTANAKKRYANQTWLPNSMSAWPADVGQGDDVSAAEAEEEEEGAVETAPAATAESIAPEDQWTEDSPRDVQQHMAETDGVPATIAEEDAEAPAPEVTAESAAREDRWTEDSPLGAQQDSAEETLTLNFARIEAEQGVAVSKQHKHEHEHEHEHEAADGSAHQKARES